MPSRNNPDTQPSYSLRRNVAATLALVATLGLVTHEISSDDPATAPTNTKVTRTCDGIQEIYRLTTGGLYDKAIEIYPENPPAGVDAIIVANPQMKITNPDLIQPGNYNIPICTLALK